ncbi:hypothetical protein NP493_142g04003 [Ridgeia piscesae]|uniref:Uncharacterized protein n=1 Tax=Ridgeia piscesae TaxID=27915 RepID=A0AAD9P504_RIDPI|nr:hypothetical protein NP493_142g04003 [Ridgeia piscesae]
MHGCVARHQIVELVGGGPVSSASSRRDVAGALRATFALSFYINSYIFIIHGHRARQPNGGRRTTLEHKYERNAAPSNTTRACACHAPHVTVT